MRWLPFFGIAFGLVCLATQPAPVPATDAVAALVAAARDGETITLPDGVTILRSPIRIHGRRGVTIQGGAGTVIDYRGPATKAVIDLEQADRCVLRGLAISVRAPGVESAIRIGNHPTTATPTTTACRIEDVDIPWDGAVILPKYGLNFESGGRDANNDRHAVVRVRCTGAAVAACRIEGTQAHQLLFDRCEFLNYAEAPGAVGILTERSGYFAWVDGSMGMWECDFRIRGPAEDITICRSNSEMSGQLLDARFGGVGRVTVTGGRWEGKPIPSKPTIDVVGQGPVHATGMKLQSNTTEPPVIRAGFLHLGPGRPMIGEMIAEGNLFAWKGVDRRPANIIRPSTWIGRTDSNLVQVDQGPGQYIQRPTITEMTR